MHSSDVRCIDINNDLLVSGSLDRKVIIYCYQNGSYIHQNTINGIWEDTVYSVRLNPDNT